MTARKFRPGEAFHPEAVRAKIKATQLVNRLYDCAMGQIELTMQQIRAIEILLRKCIPDLTSTEVKGDITHHYVAEIPEVLDQEAWERKYGSKTFLQ
jgi:hypothetical protein